MNQKKRVLHLASSNKYSGAENVICTIIENDKKKYDMFYCCLRGEIEDILIKRNISYIPLEKFSIRCLKKIVNENKIDIIHAHDFKASALAALINFRGKIVSHIHCNPDFIKKWNMYSFIYFKLSKKFSSIIMVSKECANGTVFFDKIKHKTKIIHNIVDSKRVLEMSNEIYNTPESDIVFLGRMIELKQPKKIIEITDGLKKNNNNIRTTMIGSGELLEECKSLTKKLLLDDNISFLNFLSNPFPYVKKSKVAIMPSLYEGLPMSAIECLILGIPVLNSGAGGLSELFKNYPEFICTNTQDYIDKINTMEDEKVYLEFKKKCCEVVKDYIDVKNYINRINKVYEGDIN